MNKTQNLLSPFSVSDHHYRQREIKTKEINVMKTTFNGFHQFAFKQATKVHRK